MSAVGRAYIDPDMIGSCRPRSWTSECGKGILGRSKQGARYLAPDTGSGHSSPEGVAPGPLLLTSALRVIAGVWGGHASRAFGRLVPASLLAYPPSTPFSLNQLTALLFGDAVLRIAKAWRSRCLAR